MPNVFLITTGDDDMPEVENDGILPSQVLPPRHLSPERRLLLAIIEDAVHELHLYRGMDHPRARRLYQEVRDWFVSTEICPCSFEFCCQALGFEVEALREKLMRGASLQGQTNHNDHAPARSKLLGQRERRTRAEIRQLRQQINALHSAGMTAAQIGLRLGISRHSASYFLHTQPAGEQADARPEAAPEGALIPSPSQGEG